METKQPDDFESAVRNFALLDGPADALEWDRAIRLTGDVLFNGLLHTFYRQLNRDPVVDAAGTSHLRRALAQSIDRVIAAVCAGGTTEFGEVVAEVVSVCFSDLGQPDYVDTDEILWLVGIAYGVAVELATKHRELANLMMDDSHNM